MVTWKLGEMMASGRAFARIALGCIVAVGFALYLLLLDSSLIGLKDALKSEEGESQTEWLGGVIHAVFFSGLVPLLAAIYFWIIRTAKADWIAGLLVVPGLIVFHAGVAIVMAHTSWMVYVPFVVAEIVVGACVVLWVRKRNRKSL